jgi:hypothetical protein
MTTSASKTSAASEPMDGVSERILIGVAQQQTA